MINISLEIEKLVKFALSKNLITKWDTIQVRNAILDILNLDVFEEVEGEVPLEDSPDILENISKWAVENNVIEDSIVYKDILESRIMAEVIPKQGEIVKEFYENFKEMPTRHSCCRAFRNHFFRLLCASRPRRAHPLPRRPLGRTWSRTGGQ